MITEKFIDFLQFSIDFKNAPEPVESKHIHPIRTYKHGIEGSLGERLYTGNVNSKKTLVVMSATAIHNWSKIIDVREFMADMLTKGAIFSRLDCAMDYYVGDDLIDHTDYIQYWRDEKIIAKDSWIDSTPKLISSVTDKQINMETLYFGDQKQRGKKGIVRIYDKGVDLGWFANAIVRLEVENKRSDAQILATRYCNGVDVGSLIKQRFNVLDDRWQAAIDSPDVPAHRGEGKEKIEDGNSRWAWLINTVARALGEQIAIDALQGKRTNFDIFNEEVTNAYERKIRSVSVK